MLNKSKGAIRVYLEYENIQAFCSSCLSVGHVFGNYRRLEKSLGLESTCQLFVAKMVNSEEEVIPSDDH